MPKVAIIIGSASDMPQIEGALRVFNRFEVETDVQVISAHRTPDKAAHFAKNADANGYEVIVAAAGKAAHLPGVIAAYTVLPVIGVPMKSSLMDGMDSLLSIVQMPTGVPVATVAVGGGDNAALLAIQILSLKYPHLVKQLKLYKAKLAQDVEKSNLQMQSDLAKL